MSNDPTSDDPVRDLVRRAADRDPEPVPDPAASLADIRRRAAELQLTLVAGGGTVFVFEAGDWRIAEQQTVLDVAFPGEEHTVHTIAVREYTDELRARLVAEGLQIIDCRQDV